MAVDGADSHSDDFCNTVIVLTPASVAAAPASIAMLFLRLLWCLSAASLQRSAALASLCTRRHAVARSKRAIALRPASAISEQKVAEPPRKISCRSRGALWHGFHPGSGMSYRHEWNDHVVSHVLKPRMARVQALHAVCAKSSLCTPARQETKDCIIRADRFIFQLVRRRANP